MTKKLLFFLLLPLGVFGQISYSDVNLSVDFAGKEIPFSNYWNSTGFTPGDLLFQKDMQLTLDYLSSIPNEGIKYVRPHWMLNLIGSRNAGTSKAEFNFEKMDAAFDEMVSRGFKPIFEIMGFPNQEWIVPENEYDKYAQGQKNELKQWVPDFNKKEDCLLWNSFVKQVITHLVSRYGKEEMEQWYFECTNEPDITSHFWKQGTPALLNYWDASSAAIKAVSNNFRTGGPGNARGVSDVFKSFLAHCDTGINLMTGKTGAPLDFISVHRKALPYKMVDDELECVNYIRANHPKFSKLPFWNDEADPMAGWGIPLWWRADTWYGGFVIHSVEAHNRISIDQQGINFGILGNDNGFLGNWYNRTHLARHTNPANADQFWLFKQPDLTAMSLLSLSTGNRFEVQGYSSEKEMATLIPSKTPNGDIVLLLVNKSEFGNLNPLKGEQKNALPEQYKQVSKGVNMTIDLKNIDLNGFTSTQIRIDNLHGNAFAEWTSLGQPETISTEQYKMIAANQEPVIVGKEKANNKIKVMMPPSSICMIILTRDTATQEFPQIKSLKKYTGQNGEQLEFVQWEQVKNRMVTYDVMASYGGAEFVKINAQPLFDCGFLSVLPENSGTVKYKIVANSL